MRRCSAICGTALLIGVSGLRAQAPPLGMPLPPMPAPPVPGAPNGGPDEEAHRPAEGQQTWDGPRDPFWPVGFRPAPPAAGDTGQDAPETDFDWPELVLRGITGSEEGRLLAMIEGVGIVEAGDVASLRKGDTIFTWEILEVKSDSITSRRLRARRAVR